MPAPARPPQSTTDRWKVLSAAVVLMLAGVMAYANSFQGPFVHDDAASIVNNATIQQGLAGALHPPTDGETVMGRPLVNLSFAVNYAAGKLSVIGYHAVNLVIHLLAGLTLFGLVRRTLLLPALRERWRGAALPAALAASLLWTVHPLQTEAVTYVVQRAESLAGLFYLLTFYCFARSLDSPRKNAWQALSVAACLLGVFCKETLVTAPVLVLLYDRAFAGGSFATALKQRGKYHAALAATWIPLGALAWHAGTRGGSAGFGAGVSPLAYLLTQAGAVVEYLRLCFWPHPQVFDYGNGVARTAGEVAPQLAVVLALLAGTVYLLWKKPGLGFLAAWFFVVLAPSSSIVPIATETMAEHRLYLPLAALAVLVALVVCQWRPRGSLAIAMGLAALLGVATHARNTTYQSALSLWRDTAQNRPEVARAHQNYAAELIGARQLADAIAELNRALQLQPDFPEAENNLGKALALQGHPAEAAQHFAKATLGLRLPRERGLAYFNLGSAFGQLGQYTPALAAYTQATQLLPEYAPAHNMRGLALAAQGRYKEAIVEYEIALKIDPENRESSQNYIDAKAQLALQKL